MGRLARVVGEARLARSGGPCQWWEGALPPFAITSPLPRLNLRQQLAGAWHGAAMDSRRHFLQTVVQD
jgi:hypothetical protein